MHAIEATKLNGDYLWHGSALEGLCVCKLLAAYLHTDIEVRNLNIITLIINELID